MQAMVHQVYGSPGVLELQEVDKPAVADDQVLLRVHAASVNPFDFHFLRGDPFPIRIVAGLIRPKRKIPGVDVAGKVEAVASASSRRKSES